MLFFLLLTLPAWLAAPRLWAAPLLGRPSGERSPSITDFWKREAPAAREARARLLRRALKLVRRGITGDVRPKVRDRALVRSAHGLLARLTRARPKEARYLYWYGYVSMLLGKLALTISSWERVWKLEPNFWDTASMAFELGIIYAKQGRFARSVAVYARGIPAAFHLTTRGIMASNCAESLMALGKLNRAVAMYRRSIRLRPRNNSAAYWGLMTAYDRLGRWGQTDAARRRALVLDPLLHGLVGSGVFFVPKGDVHYYLGLAYEGQGRLRKAVGQWRLFLRARPRSRWRSRARLHLARLLRVMATYKPRIYFVASRRSLPTSTMTALAAPVLRCYQRRVRLKKQGLEGQMGLALTVRKQRVVTVHFVPVARPMYDRPLYLCVKRRLRNRLLAGTKRGKVVVIFQLELGP